jgi:hypothetical protein
MTTRLRLSFLGLLLAAPIFAQLAEPRLGCFTYNDAPYDIFGIPANWIVRATASCTPVESAWRIVEETAEESQGAIEDAAPWLEHRDATSGAVEARGRLVPGIWAVFADGTPLQLDTLNLPGTLQSWGLVSSTWMLVRTDQALLLLHAGGTWSYLPVPEPLHNAAVPEGRLAP